jgi:hypothetical protein
VFSWSYRRRWPRSVLAFERELVAVAAFREAEVAAVLDPADETLAALATVEAALDAAREAYETAADADEREWAGEQPTICAEADRSARRVSASPGPLVA